MIMMITAVIWIKYLINLGMAEYAAIWIKDLTNLGMAEYNQHHRHVIYQLIDQSLQSHHPV